MNSISLLFRIRAILYSLFNGGIPFHRNEEVKPFFITGSGRCGTTLLRRILNANQEIHIPPENWALSTVIYKFRRLRFHMNWDTLVDLVAATHCQDTQGWFDIFPSDFVDNMRNLPEADQSLNRLIDQLYTYHATTVNKSCTRWGDKTPLNVNQMELILQVFPDAKFIHMVRDGVDVIYSWSNHQLYKNDIIGPAKRWKRAITSAKKFKGKYPDKIIDVRYEEMVRVPPQTVKKVCRYLGIPFDPDILEVEGNRLSSDLDKQDHYKNVLAPITDEHIGKGRRELKQKDKNFLKQEINSELVKLGYEPL